MSTHMTELWQYVTEKLIHPATDTIFDHPTMPDDAYPSAEDARCSVPNPNGYATGTEDGMLYAGTMVDACLEFTEAPEMTDPVLHQLIRGMIRCALAAYTPGFIPRNILPCDGKSHYLDSSRDQYTMYISGAVRYLCSAFCTGEERRQLTAVLTAVAERTLRNVTPENDYDLLRDDNTPALHGRMWDVAKLGNHEALRLPMIELAGFYASRDDRFLERYHAHREEAYARSMEFPETANGYWHLYALQQMMASVRTLRMLETDEAWRKKYRLLEEETARYMLRAASGLEAAFEKLKQEDRIRTCSTSQDPDAFFTIQDIANAVIVTAQAGKTVPKDLAKLFRRACDALDLTVCRGPLPVHFWAAEAYLKSNLSMKEE